jgi:signal peptidase II
MPVSASIARVPKKKRNRADANNRAPISVKRLLLALTILAVIVVADQTTKLWAVERLADQSSIEIIDSLVRFTLVYNEGGAMGTRIGSSDLYLYLAIAVLAVIGWFIYSHRAHLPSFIALSSVAGGAVGNIIDRVRLGKVIDFIDVDIPDVHMLGLDLERWWTFNIADAAISCAIVYLLIVFLFQKQKETESTALEESLPPSPSDTRE